jgi:hypothetical protein
MNCDATCGEEDSLAQLDGQPCVVSSRVRLDSWCDSWALSGWAKRVAQQQCPALTQHSIPHSRCSGSASVMAGVTHHSRIINNTQAARQLIADHAFV